MLASTFDTIRVKRKGVRGICKQLRSRSAGMYSLIGISQNAQADLGLKTRFRIPQYENL